MAKIELKEMYLTEYNRLINALRKHYTALNSVNTISGITDYFNNLLVSTGNNNTIKLDDITFGSDDIFNYTIGSQAIIIKKDSQLTSENIRKGVNIEGVVGEFIVDPNTIINIGEEDTLVEILSKIRKDVEYYYYDTIHNTIEHATGTQKSIENHGFNLERDFKKPVSILGNLTFTRKNPSNDLYQDNFSIIVKKASIKNENGQVTISTGYVDQETTESLGLSEKDINILKDNLNYYYTDGVLGVKGENPNIINTLDPTVGNQYHIIKGAKYYVNGVGYNGLLEPITSTTNFIKNSDTEIVNNVLTIKPSDSNYTYLQLPQNYYVNTPYYFDISNLKSENIKSNIWIMGIKGSYEGMPDGVSVDGEEITIDTNQFATITVGYSGDDGGRGDVIIDGINVPVELGDNSDASVKATNLTPANIKKDTTILGVTGTYEVASILQSKAVDPRLTPQTYYPDEGYNGFSSFTVNPIGLNNLEIDLNLATGNQWVFTEDGYYADQVIINKPATLLAENIKKDVNIAGVVGTYEGTGEKPTQSKTVTFNPGTADSITIAPDSGYVLSGVEVGKPVTMVPENIKSGVDIGGVVGTYEGNSTCNITINVLTYANYVTTSDVGIYYSINDTEEFIPIESEGIFDLANISTIKFKYVGYGGGGVPGIGSYCHVGTEERGKNIINAGDSEYHDTIITPKILPNDGDTIYVEMEYS